jgi:trehalose 6-phosphate phosphatase
LSAARWNHWAAEPFTKGSSGGVGQVELRPREIGLFLDVDGTLRCFAPHPDAVEVPTDLVDALSAAEQRFAGALALTSGRLIAALEGLFAPLKLRASGVYGAEIRYARDSVLSHMPARVRPKPSWLLDRFLGTFAEYKRAGFAVHYRTASLVGEKLGAALARLVAKFAAFELELVAGNLVFESRRRGFDNGKVKLMAKAPFLDRRPMFIAGDAMGRAGFDVTLARGGLAYSVDREFPRLSGCFSEPTVRAGLWGLGR